MELSATEQQALSVSKIIRKVFGGKISTPSIYDVVDVPEHLQFTIAFNAYNYFRVVFQTEGDVMDCCLVTVPQSCLSLVEGTHTLHDTDLEAYFTQVMAELELRIPDKYLKAKGWL